MRLKELTIEHFRGFYEPQSLEFAIPNEKFGSGLSVIVGPNNSGKSTVLEAMKRFAKNDPQFKEGERHNNCNVRLEIENTEEKKKIIQTYGGSNAKYEGRENYPAINNFYLISARKYWESLFSPSSLDRNSYRSQLFSINRTGSDSNFGCMVADIEKEPAKKQRFDELMKSLLPNFKSWVIDLNETGQNYVKYTTGKGDTHNSDYWGDGIISLFKVVASFVEEDDKEILVIDEPELSLHPQLQKRLAVLLAQFSTKKQIILITHSPYFVRWEDFKNGAKIIRLNKKEDKRCEVFSLKNDARYYETLISLSEDWQRPHLLDAVAREIFFGENVVFTEGQEDMGLIKKFIKEESFECKFEIFGYGSGGAGNIITFLGIAKDLGINAGAIFDGNQAELELKAKTNFPDFCIKKLNKDDIRDKFDKNEKQIKVGLFDKSGNIKPECKNEMKQVLIDLSKYFISYDK